LTCIAPIRPLQLCADGDYQPSLGVLGVPLITVPDTALREQFLNIFNIVHNKTSPVAEVMSHANLNLSFRRPIVGIKLVELQNLVHFLAPVTLNPLRDTFVWGAHRDGTFSTRSMYYILINNPNYNSNCVLWKLKLPLKIKFFLWYLGRG
jgi:hypothetical protein